MGLPDPAQFWATQEYIATRFRADPAAALCAELSGAIVGSNFLTHWGSVASFGPLTVRPDLWGQGIAQDLLGPTLELFARWGTKQAGLFTFPHSTGHVALYQKFDFWPRFLISIMFKPLDRGADSSCAMFSVLNECERNQALKACRALTDSLFEGLDVSREIDAVHDQGLGETLLLWGGDSLDGFAVCHCGPGSEAGANTCYIKFAAAKPGPSSGDNFERLLDACEAFAAKRGLQRITAGMNLGRSAAYRAMLRSGFRSGMLGLAMHRPDSPAYHRPDVYVVDDWR